MQISVMADLSIFTSALKKAEQVYPSMRPQGLNAPVDGVLMGRVSQTWEAIKEALQAALDYGSEKAESAFKGAWQEVERTLGDAGAKAGELQVLLMTRLREYLTTFIDGMLQQVRSELRVGTTTLRLSQVQLSQKVTLSTSLKATLKEVIALTSQGELQINASYTAA